VLQSPKRCVIKDHLKESKESPAVRVEDRSTVLDRLPRNSCLQVCCVFVARAASGCRWNETSADDDQRQTDSCVVCLFIPCRSQFKSKLHRTLRTAEHRLREEND